MHKDYSAYASESGLSTSVIISPPSPPTSPKRRQKLSAILADLALVKEAHLTEVVTLGEAGSKRLVLFVIVYERADIDDVRRVVERQLRRVRRFREKLELHVATPEFELLDTIREVKCIVGWRD